LFLYPPSSYRNHYNTLLNITFIAIKMWQNVDRQFIHVETLIFLEQFLLDSDKSPIDGTFNYLCIPI
jgi:hypothetical protein